MKCCKALGLLFTFLLISAVTLAQDCGDGPGLPGQDVDAVTNGCPLDTWVILLVGAALVFTSFQLYHRQLSEKVV